MAVVDVNVDVVDVDVDVVDADVVDADVVDVDVDVAVVAVVSHCLITAIWSADTGELQ